MKIQKKGKVRFCLAFGMVCVGLAGFVGSMMNNTFAANSYTRYEFQDWIYYDPVNGNQNCNVRNYWTLWNKNTTCYRFFMVDHDDTTSKSTLRLVLDHDVSRTTFDKVENVLANTRAVWKDYTGTLGLMSEDDVVNAMELTMKPTLSNISIDADGFVVYRYVANTMYYNNGTKVNYAGWWTSDLYPDDNGYAYAITENGNNRLVEVTRTRGVRPMIILDKTKIASSSQDVTDITELAKNADLYKYAFDPQTYGGVVYKQLQGFTMTNDSLVFYSSNKGNPNYGLVFGYTGEDYSTKIPGTPSYGPTGHGNDMSFDSKRNKVLLVGANSYDDIWVYDGTTLEHTDTIEGCRGSVIGYDNIHDYYLLNDYRRVMIRDASCNNLYSFDIPQDEAAQGIEYHNGYLYQATSAFEECPNSWQKYCNGFNAENEEVGYDSYYNTSIINVYNMMFNTDGTPSKNFGRRVERFVINGAANLAELETVSFHDDEMYLAFAAQSVDSTYTYKFYHFDYNEVANALGANVRYEDTGTSTTITISAGEQLKEIEGYVLSDDGYRLTKTVNAASISEVVEVCDNYRNCETVNITHENDLYSIPVDNRTNGIAMTNVDGGTLTLSAEDACLVVGVKGDNYSLVDVKTAEIDDNGRTNTYDLNGFDEAIVIIKGNLSDSDDMVDLLDANVIYRTLLNPNSPAHRPLTQFENKTADLNGDGVIDLLDANVIYRTLLNPNSPAYQKMPW